MPAAALRAERLDSVLAGGGVTAHHGDYRALASRRLGDGPSDAPVSARDQDDAVAKVQIHGARLLGPLAMHAQRGANQRSAR